MIDEKFDTSEKVSVMESAEPVGAPEYEPRQRKRMALALVLLIVALALVLIKNREFWFPSSPVAESETEDQESTPAKPQSQAQGSTQQKHIAPANKSGTKSKKHSVPAPKSADVESHLAPVIMNRAVLPPLEVEVVAGDEHRTLRPGSNSVKLDLQPKTAPQTGNGGELASVKNPAAGNESGPTTNAAERERLSPESTEADRVKLSPDTAHALSRPVNPDYPLLARQMKVQGSVMLQALIGQDGGIQALRVISGPAILAEAAREAVKQWRFKPYYQSGRPVETEARITVNFTISTN